LPPPPPPRPPPSFPTRRSSDLGRPARSVSGLRDEVVEQRERLVELRRILSAGLGQLGPPATPAADSLGDLLDQPAGVVAPGEVLDRKSTRLNSSHRTISYAVFC